MPDRQACMLSKNWKQPIISVLIDDNDLEILVRLPVKAGEQTLQLRYTVQRGYD
jgi:hypothetical protein